MLEWTVFLDTDTDVASTLAPQSPPQLASFFHYLFQCIQYHQNVNIINVHHSAPEQWPREKKTSTPKINPNESVLQLYIDI